MQALSTSKRPSVRRRRARIEALPDPLPKPPGGPPGEPIIIRRPPQPLEEPEIGDS